MNIKLKYENFYLNFKLMLLKYKVQVDIFLQIYYKPHIFSVK